MKFTILIKGLLCGIIYLLFINTSVSDAQAVNDQISSKESLGTDQLIKFENNLVTAVIQDEKLMDIIDLLGRKSGVEVKTFREIEGKITINLQKTPLEEAFQHILNDTASYVFIYSDPGSDQAKKHYPRLTKILVFPKNNLPAGHEVKISTGAGMADSSVSNKAGLSGDITNPLNDPDPEVRVAAIEAFGELKDVRAISYLTNALKDEDEDVRESAIDSLAAIGNPAAVESIMKALDDEDAYIRETAVDALAALGDKRAIVRLEGLLNDPDEDVRESVGLALKKLKKESKF